MTGYYVAAISACREADDGLLHIGLHAAVVHPEAGDDPMQLALTVARSTLPESEGWFEHHADVAPIDVLVMATIEAEKTAVPNEIQIVRILADATNEETA